MGLKLASVQRIGLMSPPHSDGTGKIKQTTKLMFGGQWVSNQIKIFLFYNSILCFPIKKTLEFPYLQYFWQKNIILPEVL